MNVLMRRIVLVLFMWLMLAGVCLGKQVYLKDGGVINGQSAWQRGNKVFVKINRDIVADFNLNEVDLRRTFPKTAAAPRHQQRKVAASVPAATARRMQPASAVKAEPNGTVPVPQPPAAVIPPTEPASPPEKAGPQGTSQEAAKMMADAVIKKDAELMKKALLLQSSAAPQQNIAVPNGSGFPVSILLIALTVSVLIIAGQWIIFQKAGHAGWKSLVPLYNMYILMQIAGKPGWWMFLLFIPLVGLIAYLFAMLSLAKKFGRSELFGVGLLLLPMIFFPLLAFGGSQYEG
ncbi:MAG: DUF5684 domain-containing protein [Desulfuromonadaceae bacterium]